MKRIMICLMLALGACSAAQQDRIPSEDRIQLEEPVMEAPVMATPAMVAPCLPEEAMARDGIGGTGCK